MWFEFLSAYFSSLWIQVSPGLPSGSLTLLMILSTVVLKYLLFLAYAPFVIRDLDKRSFRS